MKFGDVLYESKDRVAMITLNRPERFNAISETMPDDIAAAFEHANNDDTVHVVVLTGAGRGFCGGGRGMGRWYGPVAAPGAADETTLQERARMLEEELNAVKAQLKTMSEDN